MINWSLKRIIDCTRTRSRLYPLPACVVSRGYMHNMSLIVEDCLASPALPKLQPYEAGHMYSAKIHPSLLQAWRAKLSAAASYTVVYRPPSMHLDGLQHASRQILLLPHRLFLSEPRDGYGLLTVVAITVFAFISSCCAIVSTRAFLVNETCDARRADSVLGMHERRHRLLQGLHSLGRPSAPSNPRPKSISPWRQLVIDSPLEGDRLGVNLTEDSSFCAENPDKAC